MLVCGDVPVVPCRVYYENTHVVCACVARGVCLCGARCNSTFMVRVRVRMQCRVNTHVVCFV